MSDEYDEHEICLDNNDDDNIFARKNLKKTGYLDTIMELLQELNISELNILYTEVENRITEMEE